MSPIEILSAATLAGGISGIGTSLLINHRRLPATFDDDYPEDLDDDLEEEIRQAATTYATRSGRPEAADLIADKLRLGGQIQQRRQSRQGRWSR